MPYGLKYILNYDGGPDGNEPYTLEFKFKDYTGTFQNVIGVQAAVVHNWDKDDPKPGIKGSSLDISLLNKSGSLPLEDFFSVEDDHCMVIHKWRSQVLFAGFLVQDDCKEPMLDYSHPITLSATDNLGLLKDVPFNQANAIVGDGNRTTSGVLMASQILPVSGINQLIVYSITTGALAGDTMIVQGTPGSDGVYVVNKVTVSTTVTFIDIVGIWPFVIPPDTIYTITLITAADLRDKLSLAYIIRICLYSTTLALYCDVYANIIETVTATPRFLEETFVSGNDFSTGNNEWKDCYTVLSIILERFNATLFQAEGVWNIKRPDEHRYYDNEITGFRYDGNMVYVEDIVFDDIFTAEPRIDMSIAAPATFPVSGITKSILRPFKFDKETFNYKQPADLLCNYNLQKLGTLLNQYTSGSDTIKEYEMLCWFDGPFAPFPDRFIRLTIDGLGNETLRCAVVTGATGSNVLSAMSEPIDVEVGDVVKVSFSWRTAASHPFVNNAFAVRLFDGTTTRYIQADGTWDTPIGINFAFDDSGTWNGVDIPLSKPVPYRGQVQVFLNDATYIPGEENWYKDLSFAYTPAINEQLNITGQTHTNTQQPTIKNKEDIEIFIDDTLRNSIQGTMFLSSSSGLLRDRTTLWQHPVATGTKKLGEWTTTEQLYWRRVSRFKMEGAMYGLIQSTSKRYHVSMQFANVDFPPIAAGVYLPTEIVALLNPGDTFIITGTASNNGIYTAVTVGTLDTNFVEVSETVVTHIAELAYIRLGNIPRHISMLTLLKYTGLPGLNFIFGTFSVDHKYNNFNGTYWEQWRTGEVDGDLVSNYIFKYLYETK